MSHEKQRTIRSVLYRALEVQEVYQEHKKPGVPGKYVYRVYIRPRFYISYSTMLRYLSRNVKREIRIYEAIEAEQMDAAHGNGGQHRHAAESDLPADEL